MANDGFYVDWTFLAAGDLSASQFGVVKLSAANTVDVATAATDKCIGVLQDKPDANGKACLVRILGITKIKAGAAGVTAGDLVAATTAGAGVTTTTDKQYTIGRALTTATSGQYFTMLINPFTTSL